MEKKKKKKYERKTYQEYVVPKSMPITVPISFSFSFFSSPYEKPTKAVMATINNNLIFSEFYAWRLCKKNISETKIITKIYYNKKNKTLCVINKKRENVVFAHHVYMIVFIYNFPVKWPIFSKA